MGAFRKDLLLQIGPIQTTVNLHTVVPKAKSSARLVCPDHTIPLKQTYECRSDDDTHVVPWGKWDKAVETPEGWRKVDPTIRPALSQASKVLELVPVSVQEVTDHTFVGESIYWLEPSNEASATNWTLLVRQLKTNKITFVTRGGFRKGGVEKLWKLELFQGHPVLREIVFPEAINDHPEVGEMRIDKETQALVNQFIEAKTTSWEDIDTADNLKAALADWVSSGELVKVHDEVDHDGEVKPKQTHDDMIAALAEAVKQAK